MVSPAPGSGAAPALGIPPAHARSAGSPGKRVALVAGEASGDMLAALLIKGMRDRWPDVQTLGIGGRAMQAEGFDAWWPSEKLAVRGYVEVLRHYREIVAIRRALLARLLKSPPEVFIGVDAPDFNLHLEAQLRAAGVPTVQYVCPAIWAWRAERIEQIRRSVDHVLCLFPFEPALLAQHGVPATFVGHPLAEVIPMEPDRSGARERLGLDPHTTVLALMPGSRRAEVRHLLQRFLRAAQLVRLQRPEIQVVLPAVPSLEGDIRAIIEREGMQAMVQLVSGQSHTVLAACDLVLVASGTATLEAALFKRPMVVAYHMNAISWHITQRKKLQAWVGLPNILSGEFLVPELLQAAATPRALSDALVRWLDHPEEVSRVQQRFREVHLSLRQDTSALTHLALQSVCRHW